MVPGSRLSVPIQPPSGQRLHHLLPTCFRWQGAYLIGRTHVGRVTVASFHINDEYRVKLREGLIAEGVFPFDD